MQTRAVLFHISRGLSVSISRASNGAGQAFGVRWPDAALLCVPSVISTESASIYTITKRRQATALQRLACSLSKPDITRGLTGGYSTKTSRSSSVSTWFSTGDEPLTFGGEMISVGLGAIFMGE